MNRITLPKSLLLILLALSMLIACAACGGNKSDDETTEDSLSEADSGTEAETTPPAANENHEYDFYLTLGTMPTLYATLNAYAEQNPNTYMWFSRGNTISKEYSADFIHYFRTQSTGNATSAADWGEIRDKIKEIKTADPEARFHLYCDDLRVGFIPYLFEYAGVKFEDMKVTLLSDGTGTYNNYSTQTDETYAAYAAEWTEVLETYRAGSTDESFVPTYENNDAQMVQLRHLAFYVSTFSNVEFWVQSPDYLRCDAEAVTAARENMHILKKDPAEMYQSLSDEVRADYQKVVLANALVDSDVLKTLEDAVNYFDGQLSGRDKELVLILGTAKKSLEDNKFYIDSTLSYYTPAVDPADPTKVTYKGKTYDIQAGAEKVTVEGRELIIGELGVYLFFKGHPAHPANEDLQAYFAEHGIVILPHRTPVETLFWMYDVKAGGYESTAFLSCYKGQTEFLYEQPKNEAITQMMSLGFFDGTAVFEAPTDAE